MPEKGISAQCYADLAIRESGDSVFLKLKITPKAATDQIVGLYGDALKIRITAPPVDGKANAHCISFLAKFFGVPKKQIAIVSGETSRVKNIRIRTVTKEMILNKLRGKKDD